MTALSFVWVHPYSQNRGCDIITPQMSIFQEKDSLHGTIISDTGRQSMLYPTKRQI